ncbi:TetR/AcrR family transcriptional regulator [Novosphingobium sp. JCM 18896]|uniref:TetR/AcrR family transcriptional regulator n=1 Tax=Novosphingobium sp. JCM 18896 TaxID=2989731 RepID=UPI002222816A|nr:TetR family transcriptional regulator [Novosphingobium sp. JCM 18896]MCW1430670.1 TetR family transcriptional regulator [Novosphingobium sp. JCM 18896]
MPGELSNILENGGKTPERLVSAVLFAWESQGSAGMTARNLAALAHIPVSSIYHHFGSMEHLLQVAQGDACAAAGRWCERQIELSSGGKIGGPRALGSLLATLIDDWCETQRSLAFAFRQSQLMALRDPAHREKRTPWSALWREFWKEICDHLDLGDVAQGTAWLFEGLIALHLLRWRRPIDRAALEELCRGWADWLDGRLAGPSPWFDLARREAMALATQRPVGVETNASSIAAAAARTIEQHGIAGLTHRAVAAEADVTLGVVSHRYRTSADLLNAAFEAIYSRMVPQGEPEERLRTLGRQEAIGHLEGAFAPRANALGLEELSVATARDPAFAGFAAQLRYLRGRSAGPYFQAILGSDRPISPIDAAIFSAFLSGRGNACLHEDWTATAADAAPLLTRLGAWT